jgi:hypothetical protein
MLFAPRLAALFDDLGDDPPCGGLWTRMQIEKMDSDFVERVEAAFEAGLESRKAAAATVVVGTKLQTKGEAIEAAIEEGWLFFCRNRDEIDLPFSEVVAFIQAHNGGATVELIKAGFKRRLKNGGWFKNSGADHAA